METTIFEVEVIATASELEQQNIEGALSGSRQKAWDWGFEFDSSGTLAKMDDDYDELYYWIIPTKFLKKIKEVAL